MPHLLVGAEIVQGKVAENPDDIFDGAPVSATELAAKIADLGTKQQATKTDKNAIGARNVARDALYDSLELLLTFVNDLCHKQAARALAIIETSGFRVAEVPRAFKQLVRLSATTTPGEVAVEVNASLLVPPSGKKHAQRTWLFRHRLRGGEAFIDDAVQPVARTVIEGLPPFVEIEVQVAVKDATSQSAWTQSFTITLVK